MRHLTTLLPKLKSLIEDEVRQTLISLQSLNQHAERLGPRLTSFEVNKGIAEYLNANGMAQIWVENFCFSTKVVVDESGELKIQPNTTSLDKDTNGSGIHAFYKVYYAEDKQTIYVALTTSGAGKNYTGFCIIADDSQKCIVDNAIVYYNHEIMADSADENTIAVNGIITLKELLSSKTIHNPSE